MKEKITGDMINLLYDTLIKVQNSARDCEILLSDLCTVNEVLQMAQRVKAAELLLKATPTRRL